VNKQIKAVMAGIGNDRQAKSEKFSFQGANMEIDMVHWEISG